ncbi:hypothetical protein ACLMJK_001966 [Lecanora helva]
MAPRTLWHDTLPTHESLFLRIINYGASFPDRSSNAISDGISQIMHAIIHEKDEKHSDEDQLFIRGGPVTLHVHSAVPNSITYSELLDITMSILWHLDRWVSDDGAREILFAEVEEQDWDMQRRVIATVKLDFYRGTETS